VTALPSLEAAASTAGLALLGPFPTPSAALAALHQMPAEDLDTANFGWVKLPEAGMILVGNEGQGLPAEFGIEPLATLVDRREAADVLAAVRSTELPAGTQVLFDTENLAYFPSPGAAAVFLLRRRNRGADVDALFAHGLWLTRRERGIVVLGADAGAALQASFRLRKHGFLLHFVRDVAGEPMRFPREVPPFAKETARELADQLAETHPGPRRSVAKYLAYLGARRCRELAELAQALHAAPEAELASVHAQLVAAGWDAEGLAAGEPPFDPRISAYGPRTLGGVWFQLVGKWVGPRLAGWIERQP
jgi:hypothetical protein